MQLSKEVDVIITEIVDHTVYLFTSTGSAGWFAGEGSLQNRESERVSVLLHSAKRVYSAEYSPEEIERSYSCSTNVPA